VWSGLLSVGLAVNNGLSDSKFSGTTTSGTNSSAIERIQASPVRHGSRTRGVQEFAVEMIMRNSDWESNGNPMGMGIDDRIGNGNVKEWESPCMGMGMALIPVGIISRRRMQCLAYEIVTYIWI